MTALDRRLRPAPAKLTPPQRDPVCLRPETVSAIERACERRLTLVCAPAGYGKTTATVSSLRQLGIEFVWYKVDVLDRDPAVFAASLIEAFRRRYAGFGQVILDRLLYAHESPLAVDELAELFIGECAETVTDDTLIVIDDYHEASDSPDLNRILACLLAKAPEAMRLVILSRYDPAFPTAKLRVAGQVTTIGVDLLKFDVDQASVVLELHTGQRYTTDYVRRLIEITEGWPASVVLAGLAQDRPNLDSLEQALSDPRMRLDVYSYLAEQVYEAESVDTRFFLDRTCCLEHITVELANSLAGIDDAHRYLGHLTSNRVFTFVTDAGSYRYHNLFRDFLKHHYVREHGNAALRALQRVSATALEEAGAIELAVELLFSSHEPVAALEVIARAGDAGLDAFSTEALQSWLQRLSSSLRISQPWARLLAAQLHVRTGSLRPALAEAQAAIATSALRNDSWALYHAYSSLEAVHFWTGDIEARMAACEAALPHASSAHQRLHTLLSVASAAIEQRDLPRAEAAFARTDEICRDASPSEVTRRELLRAEAAYHRGDFRHAVELVPEDDYAVMAPDMAAAALNCVGYMNTGLAEYQSALSLFSQAQRIARRHGLVLALNLITENVGAVLSATGHHAEACAILHRVLSDYYGTDADPYLLADAGLTASRAKRRAGDLADAVASLRQTTTSALPYVSPLAALSLQVESLFTEAVAGRGSGEGLLTVAKDAETAGLAFVSLEARLFDAILAVPTRTEYACRVLRDCIPEQLRLGHIDLLAQELCPRSEVASSALAAVESAQERAALLDALAHHWDYATLFNHLARQHSSMLPEALSSATRHSQEDTLRVVLRMAVRMPGVGLDAGIQAAIEERGVSPTHAGLAMAELTRREHEVLRLMAEGMRNPEIAAKLFLSEATVKTHVNRIFSKLGVKSRVQAVLMYQESELKTS